MEGFGEGCEGVDGVVSRCDGVYDMLAVDILVFVHPIELIFEPEDSRGNVELWKCFDNVARTSKIHFRNTNSRSLHLVALHESATKATTSSNSQFIGGI